MSSGLRLRVCNRGSDSLRLAAKSIDSEYSIDVLRTNLADAENSTHLRWNSCSTTRLQTHDTPVVGTTIHRLTNARWQQQGAGDL